MPDTTALYQLEVKLPSGENGESRTQVVRLKREETIEFSTRGEFPSTGDSSLLYIATDENKIYRWDATSATYVVVGAAQSDIPDLSGFVTGPTSATDNAIARYDGTTGKIIQNSGITIDDSNNLMVPGQMVQGSPSTDSSISSMNRFEADLFVSGNGTAPNSPKVAGFYLGRSTSDQNRHMDIVSGGSVAYIDFNQASSVMDFKDRLYVDVSTGAASWYWSGGCSSKTFTFSGGSVTASNFIKSGSNDNYVLLGGGGHKAVSDFASADIGDDYLPLAGGTMTGAIARNYTSDSTDPVLKIGSDNRDINIFKVYSSDQTYQATGVYGYNLTYNGTGSGVANALTMYCDNLNASTQVIGWQLNQSGQMGVGTSASTSYRLTVNGSANATTLYENGTALSAKYLGISAKAADADKLDGQDGSYYLDYNNFTNKPTIPTDTGMTSVTVTGGGNAVTSASYSSSTRQLTLTKGSTFLTSESDTLQTVTNRGATTTKAIEVAGLKSTGNVSIYAASGETPYLLFQRGTDTDSYNDWGIYGTGGSLYFKNRGTGGTWGKRVTFVQDGGITLDAGSLNVASGSATANSFVKRNSSDSYVLLGGGGHKALSDFQAAGDYLPKTTYEWNKEFAAGSNGAISLGRYNVYDSQLTFDITTTTGQSISGKLVIATQNGNLLQAKVFGDASGLLVSKLIIYQSAISGSRSWIEVFCNFDGWSKNKVHIYAVALNSATVEKQMNSVTISNGVPATANVTSGDTKWTGTIINDITTYCAAIDHSHDVNIAVSTGTNELTLAHGTKYALTAGGQSFVFTTPADNNTTYGADRGISLVSGKFGHSNTAITAQSTKGLYKISYDAYGHITGTESFTLPTVNNGTLTIQKNGSTVATFTANQSGNTTANITVPSPTDYYWANVKVSSTSSTATTPSVQKIGITGSTTTTASAAVTMEYDSTYKALKFVFA